MADTSDATCNIVRRCRYPGAYEMKTFHSRCPRLSPSSFNAHSLLSSFRSSLLIKFYVFACFLFFLRGSDDDAAIQILSFDGVVQGPPRLLGSCFVSHRDPQGQLSCFLEGRRRRRRREEGRVEKRGTRKHQPLNRTGAASLVLVCECLLV